MALFDLEIDGQHEILLLKDYGVFGIVVEQREFYKKVIFYQNGVGRIIYIGIDE